MNTKKIKSPFSVGLGLSAVPVTLLAISAGAFAQEDQAGVLEEVLVSATKRQADVFDIPIAIDTFTSAEIKNSGVVDLVNLPMISPSVSVSAPTGWLQPFIRGVGTTAAGLGSYSSVAVYIDGVYQADALSLNSATFDNAESVQVMKGPQGTLYGRNATGGAILITTHTPRPGDEFEGYAEIDAGNYNAQRFNGQASMGLGEAFAGSVNFSARQRDGFVENRAPGEDFNNEDAWSLGAKLVFEPNDRASFVLDGKYREDESTLFAPQQVGQYDNFAALPGLNNPQTAWAGTVLQFVQGGVLAQGGTPADAAAAVGAVLPSVLGMASQIGFLDDIDKTADNQLLNGYSNGLLPGTSPDIPAAFTEQGKLGLTFTYSFDTFDLVSISGFSELEYGVSGDGLRADPATLPDLTTIGLPALFNQGNLGFTAGYESEVFSQEVYAVSTEGDLEWIVGAFYFDDSGEVRNTGDALGTSTLIADNDYSVESISAYAEVTYPFSDTLAVTAGARYTDEESEIDDKLFGNPAIPNVGNISTTDDQITYNLKLTYNTDDLLVYGGVSTGFKSGSLNTNNPGAGQVGPEEVTSYEIGFKSMYADGRVQLSGAAFVYDFENIQLNVLSVLTGAVFLVDGVEADVSGVELGVDAQVADGLNVFANATWLDTEYLNDAQIVATGEILAIEGNRLSQTPEFALTLGLNYNKNLSSGAFIGARIIGSYNGGSWADQSNAFGSGGDEDDSFFVANASVNYTTPSGNWTLTGYINNMFDEEYFTGGQSIANGASQMAVAGYPQHYGARLRYDF